MDVAAVHPSFEMRAAEKKIQNFLVPFLDGLRHTGKMVLDSSSLLKERQRKMTDEDLREDILRSQEQQHRTQPTASTQILLAEETPAS